jgi:uncharacterized protein (TIGR03067 family)
MRGRLIVALVALAALPAFAPAPFPRPARRGDPNAISLQLMQGDWRAVSFETIGPNGQRDKIGLWFQHVRVKGERWTYLVNRAENLSYRLAIDGNRRPGWIDYYVLQGKPTQPGMVGLIRREGNRVTILYYGTTPEKRAQTFSNAPVGWWLLVLERE